MDAKTEDKPPAPFMTPRGAAKAEEAGLKPFEINRLVRGPRQLLSALIAGP